MSSDILVRDQIFSTYDSLYDAEKKVADYLISHPSEAIEMSVSELASHCDASQATIIRFCKDVYKRQERSRSLSRSCVITTILSKHARPQSDLLYTP